MKKIILKILAIILIVIFAISINYIRKNLKEDNEQEQIFIELSNLIEDEIDTDKDETIEENKNEEEQQESIETNKKVDISKLYEKNTDFVGWLKIEGTNISYPIMQTEYERKDFYLKRNFYKNYSSWGTPYIAEYCSILNSDNVIIYGHHINNNKLFGELEEYKSKEFYNNHKIIHFNTIYGEYDYEIISVFKTVAYGNGFNYYTFEKTSSKDEYDNYIKKCKELSLYDTGKTANYGEQLITLSTCEYSTKNGRLVVVAKKIN